jgi:hypothetical protein
LNDAFACSKQAIPNQARVDGESDRAPSADQ